MSQSHYWWNQVATLVRYYAMIPFFEDHFGLCVSLVFSSFSSNITFFTTAAGLVYVFFDGCLLKTSSGEIGDHNIFLLVLWDSSGDKFSLLSIKFMK